MISAFAIWLKSLLARKRPVFSIALMLADGICRIYESPAFSLSTFSVVDIEPDNRETLFRDGAGKRQSHIPHAANYDRRGFFGDARLQGPITSWFSLRCPPIRRI